MAPGNRPDDHEHRELPGRADADPDLVRRVEHDLDRSSRWSPSPAAIVPMKDATSYDQYALLRASEQALGITTFLGKAAGAQDMRAGMHF